MSTIPQTDMELAEYIAKDHTTYSDSFSGKTNADKYAEIEEVYPLDRGILTHINLSAHEDGPIEVQQALMYLYDLRQQFFAQKLATDSQDKDAHLCYLYSMRGRVKMRARLERKTMMIGVRGIRYV